MGAERWHVMVPDFEAESVLNFADVIDPQPITVAIQRAKLNVEDAEVCLLSHFVPGGRRTLVKVLMALVLATSGEARNRIVVPVLGHYEPE